MKNPKSLETSRISITAHYTSYVWAKNNLSHPLLTTWQGKAGYHLLDPLMKLGRSLGINDLETTLLQRHHIIDHLLEKLVTEHQVSQIIELACGLSARGYRFMKKFHLCRCILRNQFKLKDMMLKPGWIFLILF
ncbi:MAG: hypothetical protein HQM11_16790 [SAR324 cluster bacterium]|nr:hypothetical protein [SAR324 cluster bacterium]